MNNYEKIMNFTIDELVEFLEELQGDSGILSDEKYCGEACPHKDKEKKSCRFDDDNLPCMELTNAECIKRWLKTSAVE